MDYEHLKRNKNKKLTLRDGSQMDGVDILFVDTKTITGLDIWAKIDQVIKQYTEIHPREVWLHLEYNKTIRQTRVTDTGRTGLKGSANWRWGISLPMGMAFKIQALDHEFFETREKVRKFMKRYPGWRTCKTV